MANKLLCASVVVAIAISSSVSLAKEPSAKKLKKAPTRVAVAGAVLVLEASLWREGAAPMAAHLQLRTNEDAPLPAGIEVDRVWLIRRKEVWSPAEPTTEVEMTEPGKPRTTMNIRFADGPQWKPGTKVTCVVRIKLMDGSEGLIRADKTAVAAGKP